MNLLIERITRRGWRRNTTIAVLASVLALTGASVASACGYGYGYGYGDHPRADGSHGSPSAGWKKGHGKWWHSGSDGAPTPTPTPTVPLPPPPTPPPTPTGPGTGTGTGTGTPTPTPPPTPTGPGTGTGTGTGTPTPTPPPTDPATPPTDDPSTPGAWPDASNTGVPAGTALTPSGGLTITKPGTVVSGLDIRGDVYIRAANVTVKDSRVTGRIDTGDQEAYPNALIQRVKIVGPYDGAHDGGYPAVGYGAYTCDGCNVRGWGKGFMVNDDVVIRNSWVHDIQVFGDPAKGGSHNETILSLGGTNITIVNNRLDAGEADNVSASLALYSQWVAYDDVLVQGNLFDGGGYCLYAGLGGSYGASGTRFVGNTFGDKYNPDCGWYGAAVAFDPGHGNQWSGNVFQRTGQAVPVPGRG